MPGLLSPRLLRSMRNSAIGAGVGAAGTGVEYATGMMDPNMSSGGNAALTGTNMLAGALLANRGFRNRLLFSPRIVRLPNHTYTQMGRQIRPTRVLGTIGALSAAPTLASYSDTGRRASQAASKALNENPDAVGDLIRDPVGSLQAKMVAPTIDRVLQYAPAFLAGLGTSIGGGLTGGLLGHYAGNSLGNLMLPDREDLPYEKRRSRERWRSLISGLAHVGGGLGGAWAASYAQPTVAAGIQQLWPRTFLPPEVTSAAK